jgi:hypothetical protein
MKKYAIIENGLVANIAIAEAEWPFPDQVAVEVPQNARPKIGDPDLPESWEVVAEDAPVVDNPVPAAVSRFQLRAAFYEAGYWPAIEKLMAAKGTLMLTKLAWADEQAFRRDSNVVAALAVALELSGHQIDELFISAAAVVA